jgi:hypothetical protein
MKNVNELRKLIRETFYLMEAPPGGYFQSLELHSKKHKTNDKSNLNGKKVGGTSFRDHPLFDSNNTPDDIDKRLKKIKEKIRPSVTSNDEEKFFKDLDELNRKIRVIAKDIRENQMGTNIIPGDENEIKTYFNEVKKLLLQNSKNSLQSPTVTSWYMIKPQ